MRMMRLGQRNTIAPQLIILCRVPVAGSVKTRLARQIGTVPATFFYRHAATALMRRLGPAPWWRTTLVMAPAVGARPAGWPVRLPRRPQTRSDLGERMLAAMTARSCGPVVLVGTDIPEIAAGDVRRAFALLGRHDAVFGPAEDGGFWLVGLRRRPRTPAALFAGVRWSGPHALADTLANLAAAGFSVGFTTTLSDVDGPADLARLGGSHGRLVRPAVRLPPSAGAPRAAA